MRPHERPPRHWAFAAGRDAGRLQDARNRRAPDLVAQILQGTLDSRIAPAAVVRGHPHDQRSDLG